MATPSVSGRGKAVRWRALVNDPQLWIPVGVLLAGLVVLRWIA